MSDFKSWYEVAEYLLANKWNSVDVDRTWTFTEDKSWSKVYPLKILVTMSTIRILAMR